MLKPLYNGRPICKVYRHPFRKLVHPQNAALFPFRATSFTLEAGHEGVRQSPSITFASSAACLSASSAWMRSSMARPSNSWIPALPLNAFTGMLPVGPDGFGYAIYW